MLRWRILVLLRRKAGATMTYSTPEGKVFDPGTTLG